MNLNQDSIITEERSMVHQSLKLLPHPIARSRAVVTESVSAGINILSTFPLSTILLFSEKGKRCDSCLRSHVGLKQCTGCRAYYYCDKSCQLKAWDAHHRRICKGFTHFADSSPYKASTDDEKLHILLLTHLMAEHGSALDAAYSKLNQQSLPDDSSDSFQCLLSLLPKTENESSMAACVIPLRNLNAKLTSYISGRFANNNFTIHCSRLFTFAHGVFPLASRFFNHSCYPSAVPVYTYSRKHGGGVQMHIKLLRALSPGDEITIPYIDTALPYARRQYLLKDLYGFYCTCTVCLAPYVRDSLDVEDFSHSLKDLRERVFKLICDDQAILQSSKFILLREALWHAAGQLLPNISKHFSDASNSGLHRQAIEAGSALLAIYCILYPNNYPLTGLHAFELAKVYWNAYVTDNLKRDEFEWSLRVFHLAKQLLDFYRYKPFDGDLCHETNPFDELRALEHVVRSEKA